MYMYIKVVTLYSRKITSYLSRIVRYAYIYM